MLGLPQLTHVRKLTVEGGKVTGERETEDGIIHLEASLPAVVSVSEKINEPRFPSFKGIMAAKKKAVDDVDRSPTSASRPTRSGCANARSTVLESTPKPPQHRRREGRGRGRGRHQGRRVPGRQKII